MLCIVYWPLNSLIYSSGVVQIPRWQLFYLYNCNFKKIAQSVASSPRSSEYGRKPLTSLKDMGAWWNIYPRKEPFLRTNSKNLCQKWGRASAQATNYMGVLAWREETWGIISHLCFRRVKILIFYAVKCQSTCNWHRTVQYVFTNMWWNPASWLLTLFNDRKRMIVLFYSLHCICVYAPYCVSCAVSRWRRPSFWTCQCCFHPKCLFHLRRINPCLHHTHVIASLNTQVKRQGWRN